VLNEQTWNQYHRRWLYLFGWLGLGETVLRLPHSGQTARPRLRLNQLTTVPERKGPGMKMANTYPIAPVDPTTTTSASEAVSPAQPLPIPPVLTAAQLPSSAETTDSEFTADSAPTVSSPASYNDKHKHTHSRPPSTTTHTRRPMGAGMLVANFIKSFLVFALSGLMHDAGSLAVLILRSHTLGHGATGLTKGSTPSAYPAVKLMDALVLTPFFVIQPFGLVAEAAVRAVYRKVKANVLGKQVIVLDEKQSEIESSGKASPSSDPKPMRLARESPGPRQSSDPKCVPIHVWAARLTTVERAVGFAWTWWFLGWSAAWFIEGLVGLGCYTRVQYEWEALEWSLIAGLWYGVWWH
jgi:hypothetical protein